MNAIWELKDVDNYFVKYNVKSKIRTVTSNIKFTLSLFMPFEDLPSIKKKMVIQALKEENRINDLGEYVFSFDHFSPNILPKSAWENILHRRAYPENVKFGQQEIESFKRVIKKIKALEKKISINGYRKSKPMLIRYFPDGRIVIDGGHHRLQAIRNLIHEKKLNPLIKIPCLIMCRKGDFHYKKFNFKGLIDHSYQLDDLIAGRPIMFKESFRGFIDINFTFLKKNELIPHKHSFLYMKRVNNGIYIDIPFSGFRDMKYMPIIMEYLHKRAKNMNIIAIENIDKTINLSINVMKENHLINEIKPR